MILHSCLSSRLLHQIMTVIQKSHRPSAEARELHRLLSSPHIQVCVRLVSNLCLVHTCCSVKTHVDCPCLRQAVLSSHDSVAQSDYGPVLPPLPDELPEDEEAMRIVCLVKNNQPLVRRSKRILLALNLVCYPSVESTQASVNIH